MWNINLLVVSSSWNLDLPVSFKLVVKLLAPGGQVGTVNISSRLLAASWSLLLVVFLLIGNDLYNSGFLFFMFANALTAWYPTPSQFKHPSHPPDPSSYLDLIKKKHCVHNCNQPYDEMHQRHWLKIKFGFPQTGKGSPKIFEIDWQTPEIHKINSFFT